jgi:hypothetical protein
MDFYSIAFNWNCSTIFVHLFVIKENIVDMETFNQIGPWITLGLLFAIVIFFCVFYITKLVKTKKVAVVLSVDANVNEQKRKLKEEIVHDIVADITPVLEKRLEKAF